MSKLWDLLLLNLHSSDGDGARPFFFKLLPKTLLHTESDNGGGDAFAQDLDN
jgi:hypothetical protein